MLFPLFATSVIDIGGKFAAGIVDTGGTLLPVSTTPVVPVVHLHLRSPQIFVRIWNDSSGIFGGLREDDSWRKPEAKYLVTLSL